MTHGTKVSDEGLIRITPYNKGYSNGLDEGKNTGFGEGYKEGFQKGFNEGFNTAKKMYEKENLPDSPLDQWNDEPSIDYFPDIKPFPNENWVACKICGRGPGPDLYCCMDSNCLSRITSFRHISSSPYSDVHGSDYTDYKNK